MREKGQVCIGIKLRKCVKNASGNARREEKNEEGS
jgi:hypothetical protein